MRAAQAAQATRPRQPSAEDAQRQGVPRARCHPLCLLLSLMGTLSLDWL